LIRVDSFWVVTIKPRAIQFGAKDILFLHTCAVGSFRITTPFLGLFKSEATLDHPGRIILIEERTDDFVGLHDSAFVILEGEIELTSLTLTSLIVDVEILFVIDLVTNSHHTQFGADPIFLSIESSIDTVSDSASNALLLLPKLNHLGQTAGGEDYTGHEVPFLITLVEYHEWPASTRGLVPVCGLAHTHFALC
jgi:hypothetical protein